MVISHILGGLGNQMFQYAAGRALSLTNDQPFSLDLGDFSSYRLHHGYDLSRVFHVTAEGADAPAVHEMLGWRANRWAKKGLRRPQLAWLRGKKFVVEPHFHYWPDLFKLIGDRYLYGYWQSERYFKQFESTIRQDFTFRELLSGRNLELALKIANSHSVSLHVRRGDYVSDPKNASIMDVCSIAYYRLAISYIAERVRCPVFYVFSDDIAWVRENLPITLPCVYIDHNRGTESHRDMQLMSRCCHHIIANSSFSWWGAWLNPSAEKIVVAPQKWFVNDSDTKDLFPSGWVSL